MYRVGSGQTMLTGGIRALDEDRTRGRRVTYETIHGGTAERVDFSAPTTRVEWMPDGLSFLATREGRLYKVNATTGTSERFPDTAKIAHSLAAITAMDADRRRTISDRSDLPRTSEQRPS